MYIYIFHKVKKSLQVLTRVLRCVHSTYMFSEIMVRESKNQRFPEIVGKYAAYLLKNNIYFLVIVIFR